MMLNTSVRTNDGAAPEAILYMPEGTHTIHCRVNGQRGTREVRVTAAAAKALQADLEKRQAAAAAHDAARMCGYFDHTRGPAAYIPKRFSYEEGKGVILEVEWTAAGRAAVEGSDYTYHSPLFLLADDGTVAGLDPRTVECGSMVNDPAFESIEPIAAAREVPDDDEAPAESAAAARVLDSVLLGDPAAERVLRRVLG